MNFSEIITAGMTVFKQKLEEFCTVEAAQPLSPEVAHAMTQGITEAAACTCSAVFALFMESKDVRRESLEVDGETLRFKGLSGKRYLGFWGDLRITRAMYQNADDTRTFFPLDVAWGMEGQFMVDEVREASAFAHAQMPSEEAQMLFAKCALFHPHRTQIKRLSRDMEKGIEPHRMALDECIRREETLPEGVCALAASMDGANVLMREPGAKRGRQAQRPQEVSQSENTAYRNAMAGTVTLYGAVPEGEKTPERLSTRYVACMPEENAVAFKRQFEAEVTAVLSKLPADIPKVFLCDAARSLWRYREASALFSSFEPPTAFCEQAEVVFQNLLGTGLAMVCRLPLNSAVVQNSFLTHPC